MEAPLNLSEDDDFILCLSARGTNNSKYFTQFKSKDFLMKCYPTAHDHKKKIKEIKKNFFSMLFGGIAHTKGKSRRSTHKEKGGFRGSFIGGRANNLPNFEIPIRDQNRRKTHNSNSR